MVDNLHANWAQQYCYDGLNRLISALTPNSIAQSKYNQTYNYDSFGNLLIHDNLNTNPAMAIDPSTNRLLRYSNNVNIYQYDSAGNLTSSGTSDIGGHSFTYNANNQIISVDNTSMTYTYSATGNRILKTDATGNMHERVFVGSEPFMEYNSDSTWTNYIYANGQRIAKVAPADVMHLYGVCGICDIYGNDNYVVLAMTSALSTYTVRAGDKLVFQQRQVTGKGGIFAYAADGSFSDWVDGAGDGVNASNQSDGLWHTRVVGLDPWVGKGFDPFVGVSMNASLASGTSWDVWISDVVLVSTDGTIQQVFSDEQSGAWAANPNAGASFEVALVTDPLPSTHYFLDDHLGTTQIELSASGAPLWQGQFTPFGSELPDGTTLMHYKFTGKERDAESGLDYFGARMYGSAMGRFMSPDPSGVYFGDPTNPQSLNLYSYVRNNPLIGTDPTGMAYCQWDDGTHDDSANTGVEGAVNSGTECTNAGGTWSHADGLGDDGNPLPTATPFMQVTVTENSNQPINPPVNPEVLTLTDPTLLNVNFNPPSLTLPKNVHFQFEPSGSYTPWRMVKRMFNCWVTDDPNGHIGPKPPEPKASTETVPNQAANLSSEHTSKKYGGATGVVTDGPRLNSGQAEEGMGTAGDAAGMANDINNCAGGK